MIKALCIFVLFSSFHQIAFACSCIGSNSVKEEYKRSDLVVIGKVISKEILPKTSNTISKVQYKIVVETAFKGTKSNDTLMIQTGFGDGDCGFEFKLEERYVIYATKDLFIGYGETVQIDNTFETDICTRTQAFDEGEKRSLQSITKKRRKP